MDWGGLLAEAFAKIERVGGTVEVARMQPEAVKGLGDILTEDDRGLSLWGAQVVLDETLRDPFKVYSDLVPAAIIEPQVCPTCKRPL